MVRVLRVATERRRPTSGHVRDQRTRFGWSSSERRWSHCEPGCPKHRTPLGHCRLPLARAVMYILSAAIQSERIACCATAVNDRRNGAIPGSAQKSQRPGSGASRTFKLSFDLTDLVTGMDAKSLIFLAERVGFEPTVPETGTPDFESGAFDHSATSPGGLEMLAERRFNQRAAPSRRAGTGAAPAALRPSHRRAGSSPGRRRACGRRRGPSRSACGPSRCGPAPS
jgi:hypothetical protein